MYSPFGSISYHKGVNNATIAADNIWSSDMHTHFPTNMSLNKEVRNHQNGVMYEGQRTSDMGSTASEEVIPSQDLDQSAPFQIQTHLHLPAAPSTMSRFIRRLRFDSAETSLVVDRAEVMTAPVIPALPPGSSAGISSITQVD